MGLEKLTDNDCRKAEPNPDRPYKVADGGGLYLNVMPDGAKYWRYKYRIGGQERVMGFGVYPEVGLAEVRRRHKEARELVRNDKDPLGERQAKKQQQKEQQAALKAEAIKFRQVADEWLRMRDKMGRAGKTSDRAERMVRYLVKAFGDVPIEDVRLQHLVPVLKKAEADAKYETRVRLQGHAIKIMGFAVARAYISASPFSEVRDVTEEGWISPSATHEPRKAVTDEPDGVAKFGELMRAIDAYEGRNENLVGAALKLLALTFVRPGDVIKARWEQFDLDGAKWSVPFTQSKQRTQRKKTGFRVNKPHEVPLSRQAVALLRELQEITGDQPFLFPGRQNGRYMSDGTLAAALKLLGYNGRHDPHGFRSSASTILNEDRLPEGAARFDPALIEMQLDHVDASVRALYARGTYWADRVNLMQYWADKVDDLRNPPKPKPDLRVVA